MSAPTITTPPGTRFTLAVRPTGHPRRRSAGVINRTWSFDGPDCPDDVRLRCDVTFDDGARLTIAASCLDVDGAPPFPCTPAR